MAIALNSELSSAGMLRLHAVSDGVIALSLLLIAAALIYLYRRREENNPRESALTILFVLFITVIGLAHLASLIGLWTPTSGIEDVLKAAAALLALTTMGLPLWVRMTDLSDAVLFLFIGAYCVAIALQGKDAPAWLRAVAVLTGLLALARSVAGFAGTPSILDLVAPFAFIVSVIASGVYLLLTAR